MHKRVATLLAAAMLLTLPGCSSPAPSEAVSTDPAAASAPVPMAPATASQPPTAPAPADSAPAKQAQVRLYPAYRLEQGEKRWGYLDRSGAFVVAPQFEVAEEFGPDGLAVVHQNNKAGLINQNGQVVLPLEAQYITAPADGVRLAYYEGHRKAIDSRGAVLFESAELGGSFGNGLAPMSRNGKYGYVDKRGTVVIEPQFSYASTFADGQALVKIKDGQYAVIGPTGQRLLELNRADVIHLAEGAVAFYDPETNRWGYASVTGDVAIEAQFVGVQPFQHGLAVVNAAQELGQERWGVITRQGAFVIPPQYTDIQDLGDGLFAVGEPRQYSVPSPYVRHAIFTAEGRQLTAFMYYDVEPTEHGLCVTDETATYFLDRAGRRIGNLPAVTGIGTIRFVGDLIVVQIDEEFRYLSRDGKTVWQADQSWPLTGGGKVVSQKYRPDRYLSIRYPQVIGLADAKAEAAINDRLKATFMAGADTAPPSNGPKESVAQFGFAVQQIGQVLVVKHTGNVYPMGAAHGMPSLEYHHFDLTTGTEYRLADLFKAGSPYTAALQQAVARQIAVDPQGVNDTNPAVRADHPFAVGPDALSVYWNVYEIASYAAGFPTFRVPYAEVKEQIDTEGAFWKALGLKVN